MVDTAKHNGFLNEQPTTGFFDKHLSNILNNLSAKSRIRNEAGDLTDHSVIGLAGLCEYMKMQGGSSTQSVGDAQQMPWASSSGDWRGFGSVRRNVDIVAGGLLAGSENEPETVSIESNGVGKYTFHSAKADDNESAPEPIRVDFRSVTDVPMDAGRLRGPGEAVWTLKVEINGRLKTGTVAVHKTANGVTIADGKTTLL